jgi:hypothetical protein
MKNLLFLLLPLLVFAQRGKTGDSTFAHRLPADVKQKGTRSELLIINQTDHDIIALVRGQYDEYIRHVYIRTQEEFTFTEMPITRFYVQFKAQEFYFEDLERTVMNPGINPKQQVNYKKITEAQFFKP